MAVTSGTVSTNTISYSHFYVKWEQTGQSTTNNETTISWKAGLYTGTNTYHDIFYSNAVKIYNVYINGVLVSNGGTWGYITDGGDHDLLSGTATIPHNDDGTKTFTISISAWTYSSSNYTGTASFVLTSIPRKATADSVAAFNDEQNPILNYTNNAGNTVTTLQACISLTEASGTSTPEIAYRDITKVGNTYTFNLTTAERNILRNNTTGQSRTLYFFVKTILNGTTYYSYTTTTMSIINANPNMSNPTYKDTNATTVSVSGSNLVIIQNKSTLQFQFTNLASYKGATLSKIQMTINGITKEKSLSGTSVSSTTYNYGTLDVSDNTSATIKLIDSRGFSKTYYVSLTIWNYYQPNAIITVGRESNFYTQSKIKVDANYASLGGHNTITIKYRIKQSTSNTWGSWVTLQDNVETSFNADNQFKWDLQVDLLDILNTEKLYTINSALDVGIPLVFYDLLNRSVGVNCIPNALGSLEVNGVRADNYNYGKCGYWENDKPRYRKFLYIIGLPNNNIKLITPDLDNPSIITDVYGITTTGCPLNMVRPDDRTKEIGAWYDYQTGKVCISTGSNRTDENAWVIIEYTKTTD